MRKVRIINIYLKYKTTISDLCIFEPKSSTENMHLFIRLRLDKQLTIIITLFIFFITMDTTLQLDNQLFRFQGNYQITVADQRTNTSDLSSCLLFCLNTPCCIIVEFRGRHNAVYNCRWTTGSFDIEVNNTFWRSDLYQRDAPAGC